MSDPVTTIPASKFGDALLLVAPGVAWRGPLGVFEAGVWHEALSLDRSTTAPDEWFINRIVDGEDESVSLDRLRLPLTRPEARAQLQRVLLAGERCPLCAGSGKVSDDEALRDLALRAGTAVALALPALADFGRAACAGECHGSGYLRRPSSVRHLMPAGEGGDLPDALAQHAPALLAHHALDVAAGGRGVVGVIPTAWRDVFDGHACRDHNEGGPFCVARATPNPIGDGWWFKRGYYDPHATAKGPETGDAGKSCADAAALSSGYALVDEDGDGGGLRLPTRA